MPVLGALFVSLATGIASFFASFLTRKVAVATAAVAALATITGVLLLAFNAAVVPLLSGMFATSYGQFMGLGVSASIGDVHGGIYRHVGCVHALPAGSFWQRR